MIALPTSKQLLNPPDFCREGETANQPWPLRSEVWGVNRLCGIMIPNEDVLVSAGIIKPKDYQPRPKACMVMKLSEDITDWLPGSTLMGTERPLVQGFRALTKIRDQYFDQYSQSLPFYSGHGVLFLAGSADEVEYKCPRPPDDHWMRPFYNEKGYVTFCFVNAVSVLFSYDLLIDLRKMTSNVLDEARAKFDMDRKAILDKHTPVESGKFENIGIMVKDGASPNRV